MSEYQYYELRSIDRPLTEQQMSEIGDYSSRARITPDSFVNVYNWGDFKGDPDRWIEKYFDAFLYLANWGTRTLMLRVPLKSLDFDCARTYCDSDSLSCRNAGSHLILSFRSEEEDYEWAEGEGWLASLAPLRSDLIYGDYRCLYLGWLLAAQMGELDDDELEPPVPPGLGQLSAPLRSLVDFLRIDTDLIAAAAEKSEVESPGRLSVEDISAWVAKLPPQDKDALLVQLIEGDNMHIAAELRYRALSEIRGERASGSGSPMGGRRTVGRLVARGEAIEQKRRKAEVEREAREKAERERAEAEKRKRYLESLKGKERSLGSEIERLIATKQPRRYDEAVSLLEDLRELADMTGTSSQFDERMSALCQEHVRKPSLIERFRKAKLSI